MLTVGCPGQIYQDVWKCVFQFYKNFPQHGTLYVANIPKTLLLQMAKWKFSNIWNIILIWLSQKVVFFSPFFPSNFVSWNCNCWDSDASRTYIGCIGPCSVYSIRHFGVIWCKTGPELDSWKGLIMERNKQHLRHKGELHKVRDVFALGWVKVVCAL